MSLSGQKPPHAGHRARLFKKSKTERLSDNELLELLLFYALPRCNTNDIAHALLSTFGSLKGVLSADLQSLQAVKGVGESVGTYLQNLGELTARCVGASKGEMVVDDASARRRQFQDTLGFAYKDEKLEVVDVYLLNDEATVFKSLRLAQGKESHAEFKPQTLAKIFVEYAPAGIVLAHNHPSGNHKPSATDEAMTEQCQVLCSLHNVMFCDHIIYAGESRYSYYESGKLQGISAGYSITRLICPQGAPDAY